MIRGCSVREMAARGAWGLRPDLGGRWSLEEMWQWWRGGNEREGMVGMLLRMGFLEDDVGGGPEEGSAHGVLEDDVGAWRRWVVRDEEEMELGGDGL
ncbi:hypothetical protein MRB53_026614 [Persea americana]|uniref:Uncharacterized protein n=1 Tax=Persea americana TaxID=3435 RepID=A0ACC2LIU4_PERAE|nr:hypothetical protein MRB53_026614 [Persea americana]